MHLLGDRLKQILRLLFKCSRAFIDELVRQFSIGLQSLLGCFTYSRIYGFFNSGHKPFGVHSNFGVHVANVASSTTRLTRGFA